MIPDSDKLILSLLQKQGITTFLAFDKPSECNIEGSIYGYIKDGHFVFCDITLNEFDVENVYGKKLDYYVIVKNDTSFSFAESHVASGSETFLINSLQEILSNSDDGFTTAHSSFFFMSEKKPIAKPNHYAIIHFGNNDRIYTCNNQEYIHKYSQPETYSFPKFATLVLSKGKLIDNLRYLFSTKYYHVFFEENLETKEKYLLVFDEHGYQVYPKRMPRYVWVSNDKICFIYADFRQQDNSTMSTRYLGCYASSEFIEVEFSHDFTGGKYLNFTIFANKNFLILLDDDRGYGIDYAVISIDGEILSNQGYAGSFSSFRDNILFLHSESHEAAYDVCGNEICYGKGCLDREIFSRTLNGPRYFADETTGDQPIENIIRPKLYGVIEPRTGNVVIPPIYDSISEYHTCELGIGNSENKYYTIYVVASSYVLRGEDITYKGAYINGVLFLPVFFDDIVIPTFSFLRDNGHLRYEESNYIFACKNKVWTLYYTNGTQISSLNFDSLELLKSAPVPYNCHSLHDYVLGKCDKTSYIIYKQIIATTSDDITSVVLTPIGYNWSMDYRWAKATSSKGEAIIFEGNVVSDFYPKIDVYQVSEALNTEGYLFIVESSDNLFGVLNGNNEELLPFMYKRILVYPSCLRLDNSFTDIKGNVLFEVSQDCRLITEKKTYTNERCLVFSTPDALTFVEIYNHGTTIYSFGHNDYPEKFEFLDWVFDFDSMSFIRNPEDEDNRGYDDYPDDTDYERDTFYALGGDDYDEWKNNGGNLDDMMDGMGY